MLTTLLTYLAILMILVAPLVAVLGIALKKRTLKLGGVSATAIAFVLLFLAFWPIGSIDQPRIIDEVTFASGGELRYTQSRNPLWMGEALYSGSMVSTGP
jgi:hypothetical protein